MHAILTEEGFAYSQEPEEADLLVVNTCAFIDEAKAESIRTILEAARSKDDGKCSGLIVTGCLAQRFEKELMSEMPEIDAVIGTGEFRSIGKIARQVLKGKRIAQVQEPTFRYDTPVSRIRSTPSYTAYLKISEGCNHTCSFCIIPTLRGRHSSRRPDDIVEEAKKLADEGVKEINLIAQDSTYYGYDLSRKLLLPDLLRRLNSVAGIDWIRFHYAYPTLFTQELIDTMADLEKICPYVDIPLQHGSDRILTLMRRAERRERIVKLVEQIRERIPDVVFRSSFIVGFPGETEDDFQQLLDLLTEIEFDYVGFFTYSQEEGTRAYHMPDQIPDEIKQERYHRAMEHQATISRKKHEARIGQHLEVLVEGEEDGQPGYYRGRWRGQAIEVDGQVIFSSKRLHEPGEIVPVRIERAEEYDLLGVSC